MIVCSACLAGMACKYSGKNNNIDQRVVALVNEGKAVPLCPEMLGGLSVPRIPCEVLGERVINQNGDDMTGAFTIGARRALAITKGVKANEAILMPRSPSCGIGKIYDGTFQKKLVVGDGLFVRYLKQENVMVYRPDDYFNEEKKIQK